jgi:hypothetical protein
MQRKNNLLKSSKNAMAMIMAIATIVILSSIMALSLMMSAKTSKSVDDLYLYEQSQLYTKSATEYALLQIAKNPPCSNLDTNFIQDSIYDINISILYIYYKDASQDPQDICDKNGGKLYTTVSTPEQNGSALIDVRVGVTDSTISSEKIVYFRRTLQKL